GGGGGGGGGGHSDTNKVDSAIAIVSVSQAFAGVNVMEEFPTMNLPEGMSEEEKDAYRAQLLDHVLFNCVKDMVKQLKKARRDPILKRDFRDVFAK
ncbi:DUF3069 domain-containing protein, partial [Vibrio vulnificus]|uniref:DUF3069 domain-containing protein n=1 Tax=Vibrio vulnificus TaxID=672 RepID=UPI001EEB5132